MSSLSDFQPESFIPVSRFALLERLQEQSEITEAEQYAQFHHSLALWRHQYYRTSLHRLKELYLPFSPDRDTLRILSYDRETLQGMRHELIQELTCLLTRANYSPLTKADLRDIFSAQSAYGLQLNVELDEFENILLFSRGAGIETSQKRTANSLFLRKETVEIPVFQRLFLLLKLKPESIRIQEIMQQQSVTEEKARKLLRKYRDMLPERISSEHIYLKIFKQIPQIDLEMLFPNTQVKLRPFDKLKLGITAGGGTAGSIIGTVTKLAAAANPTAIAGVMLGLVAVIFRQVSKFFTQRTKYMMVLAQKLYFHNLANNRGVLTLMTDRAEEEDIKECFLLYHFLLQAQQPQSRQALKKTIENFVEQQFGVSICFNVDSPVAALKAGGILIEEPGSGLRVLPLKEAGYKVKDLWRVQAQEA